MNKKEAVAIGLTDSMLSKEWHPTKNGSLTPQHVAPMSHKRVWWKCNKGHTWEASVANRSRGSGCPYCNGKKVSTENSLQSVNAKLARSWHPTKNGSLTAKDVTPMSNKKVWWKCKAGHEWVAKVSSRSQGTGCPYDTRPVLSYSDEKSKLKNLGFEVKHINKVLCLANTNPELTLEWHPTKNGSLTPQDVSPRSHKKVWWERICNGTKWEWQDAIHKRTEGRGCPQATGRTKW